MSTGPKFKLQTQPMDVTYSALFKGDMTQQLPKDNIFPCPTFWFFEFFWTFSNI